MTALRWVGFAVGVAVTAGTVVAVMKTLIVPRRSWSILSASVGRVGFKLFHGVARRLPSYDLADRLLGFQAPFVIVGILVGLLGAFVVGFALMLLPWAEPTLGDALREAGSSVFTLGFIFTDAPVPTVLDVLGGATGMIFVALTIGYLPAMYSEIKRREATVRRLEGTCGTPSWGPEVLARHTLAGALDSLPTLYDRWDGWCARVAETHLKYPVLTHFRRPRARNHWVVTLLAVLDAAALDITLRPSQHHGAARLLLDQGVGCLEAVAYPMRRVDPGHRDVGLDRTEYATGVERLVAAGFPVEGGGEEAWEAFASLRSRYAPLAQQLAFWLIAAPAPWSGDRDGFPGLTAAPEHPLAWPAGDPPNPS